MIWVRALLAVIGAVIALAYVWPANPDCGSCVTIRFDDPRLLAAVCGLGAMALVYFTEPWWRR